MEPASHPSPAELDMAQLAITGLATIMTLLSVAIFVEEAFYLTRKIRCPIKMKTLCWSSSAPTVVSVVSCFGLWIPRSMMVVEMATTMYFAICFYLLMLVMVEGFGGKEAVLSTLKDVPMVVSTGPCCCCCPCLPRITMSRRKLQLLMLGTFQYAFCKAVAVFLGLVLATDGNYNPADISAESVALWINTVVGASTLFGLWALAILFRQARLHLAEQNIQAKFSCFQVRPQPARLPPGEGLLRHERDEAEWGGWWGRSRWRARATSGCGRARKVKGRSLAAARPPPPWVLVVAGPPPPDGTAARHLQHPGQQRQHRLLAALLLQGQVAADERTAVDPSNLHLGSGDTDVLPQAG
ncbi:organic solute transporter subunit alpha isoform 1-T1 [Morphnus guianensis]